MGIKSPTEPIVLSDKDYSWLEKKLAKNNARTALTPVEKQLLDDSKAFDKMVMSFAD